MNEPYGYRELLESCAVVPADPQALLSLQGEDAKVWLHGQTTQDILSMETGDCREACVCSATGQIRWVLSVLLQEDSLYLSVPSDSVAMWRELHETTVFMEDVLLSEVDEPVPVPPSVLFGRPDALKLRLNDSPGLVFRGSELPDLATIWLADPPAEAAAASLNAWEAVRLEHNLPKWGVDFDAKTLPAELGPDFLKRTVSFTKGCYTGQEVILRIHARGHTNRTWRVLAAEGRVARGDAVKSDDGERAGQVTSAALSPRHGWLAGALVLNKHLERDDRLLIETECGPTRAAVPPSCLGSV